MPSQADMPVSDLTPARVAPGHADPAPAQDFPDAARQANGSIMTFGAFSEGRRNNFDFIRFFLAALVILGHSYDLMLKPELLSSLTNGQLSSGGLAVSCFFLLSGFLITKSWMQTPNLGKLLGKRVRRILPGFAVALLFCVFVVGPLSGVAIGDYFRSRHTYAFLGMALGAGVTGLPGVFLNNPLAGNVNGSLWTIRIEFLCYLLVAALGVAGLARRRGVLTGLFALTLLLNALRSGGHLGGHWPFLIEGLVGLMPLFLAGAVFYSWRDRIPYHPAVAATALTALALCCLAKTGMVFALPTCGAYLLFYAGFSPRGRMQNFGRRGDLSYGVYLYAFPIQQLLIEYGQNRLSPPLLFLMALPLASALAALSWRFVEKPFLSRRRTVTHNIKIRVVANVVQ